MSNYIALLHVDAITYPLPKIGLSLANLCQWKNTFGDIHVTTTHKAQHAWWWRRQMETFSALLPLCAGNSPVTGEFPSQMPVTRTFDLFFDLRLNNGWVDNREAGDWRRHRAHYDVTVMWNNVHISLGGPLNGFLDPPWSLGTPDLVLRAYQTCGTLHLHVPGVI